MGEARIMRRLGLGDELAGDAPPRTREVSMADPYEKITQARGILANLASHVPGFSGYLERSTRREADRLLRETVAQRYQSQGDRISEIQRRLVGSGEIERLDDLESAAVKLRAFIDQVRTAPVGYAGFFDAVKVDEAALARLYAFDQSLLEGEGELSGAIDDVAEAVGTEDLAPSIIQMTRLVQVLNETFDKRRQVLTA